MRYVSGMRPRRPVRVGRKSAVHKAVLLFVLGLISLGLIGYGLHTYVFSSSLSNETTTATEVKTDSTAQQIDTPETLTKSMQLQKTLDDWIAQHDTGYRVVARSLDTDDQFEASYKAATVTIPASTYKLFVVYAAFHQIEFGEASLDAMVTHGDSMEDCIEEAIIQSDNECAEAIGFYLGWDTVDSLVSQAGFTHTKLNNYDEDGNYMADKESTAEDLASLLTKLYNKKLVNTTHTNTLLGYMKGQVYRSGIPAGVTGTQVADKVGFLPGITNDAAIVYAEKPYVLVVLSTATNNWVNIADLAQNVQSNIQTF